MKLTPYLCIESRKEAVKPKLPKNMIAEEKERAAMFFDLQAKDNNEAEKSAESMGAKVIRPLTEKEVSTGQDDGSYEIDIENE